MVWGTIRRRLVILQATGAASSIHRGRAAARRKVKMPMSRVVEKRHGRSQLSGHLCVRTTITHEALGTNECLQQEYGRRWIEAITSQARRGRLPMPGIFQGTFPFPNERGGDEQQANGTGGRSGCPGKVDRRRQTSAK